MADNVQITEGSGTAVHADEYTDSTYGAGKSQQVKIADATPGSSNKMVVNSSGEATVKATDSDALLTTIDADTSTIAGAVSGTEMQIDLVGWTNDYTNQLGRVHIVNSSEQIIDFTTQVAHDAADSGSPTKLGTKARDGISDVTLVSENDRTDQYGTLDGKMVNFPYCAPADIVDGEGTATASTSNVAVLSAAGAGIRNYVTTITATNTSGTDTEIAVKDGTTTKMTLSVPANGGVIVNLPVPMRGTANTAFNFAAADSVSSVLCAMVGFTSKA